MKTKTRTLLFGLCIAAGFGGVTAAHDDSSGQGTTRTTPPAQAAPPAQQVDATNQARQPQPQKPKDRIICKKLDAPTGTRVGPRKVCKTKAQWDDVARRARETTDFIQDRGRIDNGN